MIFKIQRPLVAINHANVCLAYNEDRSILFHFNLPNLKEVFGNRLKLYAECAVEEGSGKKDIIVQQIIRPQPW